MESTYKSKVPLFFVDLATLSGSIGSDMANFRMERLFVILDEPVPGLNHLKAVDATEFAWHSSDSLAERLGVTQLGDFTFAPFDRPTWHDAREGLATIRRVRSLYAEWLAKGENPMWTSEALAKKDEALRQAEEVLAEADSLGRRFYLSARDLA